MTVVEVEFEIILTSDINTNQLYSEIKRYLDAQRSYSELLDYYIERNSSEGLNKLVIGILFEFPLSSAQDLLSEPNYKILYTTNKSALVSKFKKSIYSG